MHKKALTVAIAGALAAPMAAQAVDITLSGHINRAIFITDSDDKSSTSASVSDNASSGTRIRVTGSGEMMDGGSAGVNLEYAADTSLKLRYGEVWFSGDYGKLSLGQGDQGGEGSVYNGAAAVLGTGHGQATGGAAVGNYYDSFDGGAGRNERIRYDTPSVGPVSAAISVGNGDQVSAGIKLSQEFGGTSFSAGIGTVQWPGGKSTVSGSAGVGLASGISISGAWGKGKDYAGMTIPGMDAVPNTAEVPADYRWVNTSEDGVDTTPDDEQTNPVVWETERNTLQTAIDTGNADGATNENVVAGETAQMALEALFASHACDPEPMGETSVMGDPMDPDCTQALYANTVPEGDDGSDAVDAMETTTDPSFFQVAVSYAFGDTSVGVSWYQSSDMYNDGSELTAIGAGVNHNLPKLGANVYAAAQNYSVEDGATETDDTVIMIGARIKF